MFKQADKRIVLGVASLVASFVAIFFSHDAIGRYFLIILAVGLLYVYVLRREISKNKSLKPLKLKLAYIVPSLLLFVGSFGIAASVNLTRDKISILENPDFVASCSLSPVVACSPIIGSEQASVFGIPNPLFGIFGFGALIIAGMSLLAGGTFTKWWWRSLYFCTLLGFIFCAWLVWQSLYVIGALCLYCNSVWALVALLLVYLTLHGMQQGYLPSKPKVLKLLSEYHAFVLFVVYALIATLVYFRFDYYWATLL